MVALSPVAAWHPNPSRSDPSSLVCPVYDTLSPEEVVRYASQPFNAAGFVARAPEVSVDRFPALAAGRLLRAVDAGAYLQDPSPALYVYGIQYQVPEDIAETYAHPDRRPSYLLLGLVGTLTANGPNPPDIALHERVFEERVEERRRLGAATGMQFAPIMAGYSLPDHAVNDLIEAHLGLDRRRLAFAGTKPPLLDVTLDAVRHRVWRLEESETAERILGLLASLRVLVLDGHHRISAQLRGVPNGVARHPLVMLVEARDRGLLLRPWHRLLPHDAVDATNVGKRLRERFPDAVEVPGPRTPERLVAELIGLRHRRRHGFVALGRESVWRVEGPIPPDAGADFELLHRFLEVDLGLDPRRCAYARSPRRALEAVDSEGGMAFLLPTTTVEAVERLAFEHHRVMAQKSTMFLPKVLDGLLFAPWSG